MNKEKIFARKRDDGNYDILEDDVGYPITRMPDINEYPVNSEFSVQYEHPEGIVFTQEQVNKHNIEIE